MGALIRLIGVAVAKVFGDQVLRWVAIKAILVALFTVVVPLVLNNFLYDIIEIIMNFASETAEDAGSLNGALEFTGFGAWLMERFKVPDALSVLVAALSLRSILNMIPFVRL